VSRQYLWWSLSGLNRSIKWLWWYNNDIDCTTVSSSRFQYQLDCCSRTILSIWPWHIPLSLLNTKQDTYIWRTPLVFDYGIVFVGHGLTVIWIVSGKTWGCKNTSQAKIRVSNNRDGTAMNLTLLQRTHLNSNINWIVVRQQSWAFEHDIFRSPCSRTKWDTDIWRTPLAFDYDIIFVVHGLTVI
jgi:hypothetical protein